MLSSSVVHPSTVIQMGENDDPMGPQSQSFPPVLTALPKRQEPVVIHPNPHQQQQQQPPRIVRQQPSPSRSSAAVFATQTRAGGGLSQIGSFSLMSSSSSSSSSSHRRGTFPSSRFGSGRSSVSSGSSASRPLRATYAPPPPQPLTTTTMSEFHLSGGYAVPSRDAPPPPVIKEERLTPDHSSPGVRTSSPGVHNLQTSFESISLQTVNGPPPTYYPCNYILLFIGDGSTTQWECTLGDGGDDSGYDVVSFGSFTTTTAAGLVGFWRAEWRRRRRRQFNEQPIC